MTTGTCECCGTVTKSMMTEYCDVCIENDNLDMETEEENLPSWVINCDCGAYQINSDGTYYQVSDCCC